MKQLKESAKRILSALSIDLTMDELVKKTGLNHNGIRGRISELRKFGYDIVRKKDKYHLKSTKQGFQHNLIMFEIRKLTNKGLNVAVSGDHLSENNAVKNIEQINTWLNKLMTDCCDTVKEVEKNKEIKKDAKLNWELGNLIHDFNEKTERLGYRCGNFPQAMEDYAKCHRREYWRVRMKFREKYPLKKDLMPVSFNTYNELLVINNPKIRKQLEEKIQSGGIKTTLQLRELRWKLGGTKKGSPFKKK